MKGNHPPLHRRGLLRASGHNDLLCSIYLSDDYGHGKKKLMRSEPQALDGEGKLRDANGTQEKAGTVFSKARLSPTFVV